MAQPDYRRPVRQDDKTDKTQTIDGVDVQQVVRETEAGTKEYVKLSQTKTHPDGSERTKDVVIARSTLRAIAGALFPALARKPKEAPAPRPKKPVEYWPVYAFEKQRPAKELK